MKPHILLAILMILVAGCTTTLDNNVTDNTSAKKSQLFNEEKMNKKNNNESPEEIETATFAGGCFWCIEAAFQEEDGVLSAISGYSGGSEKTADYKTVSSGKTNHFESLQVKYDPSVITYRDLLDIYWRQIDPTDDGGQFTDRGPQYRTAIFYENEKQKKLAEESKKELQALGKFDKPIVTQIIPFKSFYKAEEYHQDYYLKKSLRYNLYKKGSGREAKLRDLWPEEKKIAETRDENNKEASEEYKPTPLDELSFLQRKVTQEGWTEPPFVNKYWNNKQEGIYVDVVSGEPLFSSKDKYKSGTGWPSFTKPIDSDNIIEVEDDSHGIKRTEIKSKKGNSHLGHVFNDGPAPTGLRYCMNSAALRFIPKEDLEKEGYGKYMYLFE